MLSVHEGKSMELGVLKLGPITKGTKQRAWGKVVVVSHAGIQESRTEVGNQQQEI